MDEIILEAAKDKETKVLEAPKLEYSGDGQSFSDKTFTPLELVKQNVNIDITSGFAQTTSILTFKNNTEKTLEGELKFNLAEDATVCSYGLDVEGKIVDAVPVTKEKARTVFEQEVRERSDKQVSIVEVVAGNVFKTRVYPIRPQQERTIKLQTLDELKQEKTKGKWNIVSHWQPIKVPLTLKEATITINLNRSESNMVTKIYMKDDESNVYDIMKDKAHTITLTLEDIKSRLAETKNGTMTGLLIMNAMEQEQMRPGTMTLMQTEYDEKEKKQYFAATFQVPEIKEKVKETQDEELKIALLWDMSNSTGIEEHKEAKLKVIEALLAKHEKVNVTVYAFHHTLQERKTFTQFDELKDFVTSLPNDGGTNLTNILSTYNVEQETENYQYALVVSDGFTTVGGDIFALQFNTPLYLYSGQTSQNTTLLKYLSQKSGGQYLSMANAKNPESLIELIGQTTPSFLNIKCDTDVEFYPSIPQALKGATTFTIYGCKKQVDDEKIAQATILFGNDATDAKTIDFTVMMDTTPSPGNTIAKLWAQKKIAQLQIFGSKYEEELLQVGREYHIATPNTSLIVLETLDQYLKYGIRPSDSLPEIQKQFDETFNKKEISEKKEFDKRVVNWANKFKSTRVEGWYNKNFEYKPRAPKPKSKKKGGRGMISSLFSSIMPTRERSVQMEMQRNCAPTATNALLSRDNCSRSSRRSYVPALNSLEEQVSQSAPAPPPPPLDAISLSEDELQAKCDMSNSEYSDDDDCEEEECMEKEVENDCDNFSFNDVADQIETKQKKKKKNSKSKSKEKAPVSNKIKIKAYESNATYMQSIRAAKDPYAEYLIQKQSYSTSPSFFLDVADYFLSQKTLQQRGVQALLNILELNVEDPELMRIVGYRLFQAESLEMAIQVFRSVLRLRPESPQSYRDLGLALECAGHFEEAAKQLYHVVGGNWDGRFSEIQFTAIVELNHVFYSAQIANKPLKWEMLNSPAPLNFKFDLDLRVSMTWSADMVDIDLHVIEPTNEECYYSHNLTEIGGKLSRDFTQGCGPEEYMLKNHIKGDFNISAKYFSNHQQSLTGGTTVLLTFYKNYMQVGEERALVTRNLSNNQSKVHVCTVTF